MHFLSVFRLSLQSIGLSGDLFCFSVQMSRPELGHRWLAVLKLHVCFFLDAGASIQSNRNRHSAAPCAIFILTAS